MYYWTKRYCFLILICFQLQALNFGSIEVTQDSAIYLYQSALLEWSIQRALDSGIDHIDEDGTQIKDAIISRLQLTDIEASDQGNKQKEYYIEKMRQINADDIKHFLVRNKEKIKGLIDPIPLQLIVLADLKKRTDLPDEIRYKLFFIADESLPKDPLTKQYHLVMSVLVLHDKDRTIQVPQGIFSSPTYMLQALMKNLPHHPPLSLKLHSYAADTINAGIVAAYPRETMTKILKSVGFMGIKKADEKNQLGLVHFNFLSTYCFGAERYDLVYKKNDEALKAIWKN